MEQWIRLDAETEDHRICQAWTPIQILRSQVKFYNRKKYGPATVPLVDPMSPDGKSLEPKNQTYQFWKMKRGLLQYVILTLGYSHCTTDLANLWARTLQLSWTCQTVYSLLISHWNYSVMPNNDVKPKRRNAANCQICYGIITFSVSVLSSHWMNAPKNP